MIVRCTATTRRTGGTNPLMAAYRQWSEIREAPMKMTKIVLAGFAATLINSVALAQQPQTGTITQINRISGTIAIQQAQSGTVGAGSGGAAQEFKVQGAMLDTLHAGDKVTFSATETGGTKTITKLEKQ